jgi:hypothetical protein
MRGFGVTRRRGTEVGGVLLGRIDAAGAAPIVSIYDYEAVPCEYSQGPSYLLSERDLQVFREAVSKWRREVSPDRYVVGYYRSHTRDGLFLDENDARLFHDHIRDPQAVALVVKPYATRVCDAGFFLQKNGKLVTESSPLEFPFQSKETVEVAPGPPVTPEPPPAPVFVPPEPPPKPEPPAPRLVPKPRIVERPVPRPPAQPAEQPLQPPPESPREQPMFSTYYPADAPSWRRRSLWVAFTLAALGFGSVAGYLYGGGKIESLGSWVVQGVSKGAPRETDPYSVNLTAAAQGQSVLIRWNRESSMVQAALRGVLSITENGATKEVALDAPELRNGTVLYHSASSEIRFRLDLYFKDNRMFAESVILTIQSPPPAAQQ